MASDSAAAIDGYSVKTQCQLCLKQAVDPSLHNDCGKGFCEACLEEYGREKPCPSCKGENPEYSKDEKGDNDIRALIEKCETDDVFETLSPDQEPQEDPVRDELEKLELDGEPRKRKKSVAFNVTDFTAKRESNSQFSCPSFYTGPGGYHIAVRVGANGEGETDALSLYACILKGNHDDELSWPFVGQITVTLVNQIEDKNHAHMVVKIEESDNVHVDSSWGISSFIPHKRLDFDPYTNTQYLKDDTLHFRVIVEVDP